MLLRCLPVDDACSYGVKFFDKLGVKTVEEARKLEEIAKNNAKYASVVEETAAAEITVEEDEAEEAEEAVVANVGEA